MSDVYQDVLALLPHLSEEEQVKIAHEINVCPFDCDGCHGEDCICDRVGCDGEKD